MLTYELAARWSVGISLYWGAWLLGLEFTPGGPGDRCAWAITAHIGPLALHGAQLAEAA